MKTNIQNIDYDAYNDILHFRFTSTVPGFEQAVTDQLVLRREAFRGRTVGVSIKGVQTFHAEELERYSVPNERYIRKVLDQVQVPLHRGLERIGEL